MKVIIGTKIFNSAREPILLILSEDDKYFISEMGDADHYCSYPSDMTVEAAEAFMKGEGLS